MSINDKKISALTPLGVAPASDDVFLMLDKSSGTIKSVTKSNLLDGIEGADAHNDLDSLQGGAAGECYHLLNAEYAEISAWLDDVTLGSDGQITIPQMVLDPRAAALNDVKGGMYFSTVDDSIYVCTADA